MIDDVVKDAGGILIKLTIIQRLRSSLLFYITNKKA